MQARAESELLVLSRSAWTPWASSALSCWRKSGGAERTESRHEPQPTSS